MVILKPICVNGSNCQGSSQLPPCVGSCGGGGGTGGGSFPEWNIEDGYLVDTIVINEGVLYVANSDIPPGTPFEVGDIPGTWRPVEAGSSSIPPFNPESSYAQFRPVTYEGRIYIANTALPPGPFNPADWTEINQTATVATADTVSVDLTGNGSALDPLIASLNLDPSATNLLQVTVDGLLLDSSVIPTPGGSVDISEGVTMNVDVVTGDDATADGTIGSPFATIGAAMAAATVGDVVLVWPGVYATFTPKSNVTLRTQGAVTINGALTVSGTNVRIRDLTINGALTFSGATGGMLFENIALGNNDVIFTGVNSGAYALRNFDIAGQLQANDPAQGATALTVAMFGPGDGLPAILTDAVNGRFYVGNRQAIGNVLARKGLLVLSDIGRVQNTDYTADAASGTMFVAKNVSLYDPQTRLSANFTKTGDGAFLFSNFSRDPTTDETGFAGSKVFVENARDIHGQYAPVNYVAATVDIAAHLKGIDDALANAGGSGVADLVFSLQGGWDEAEILFSAILAHDFQFPADFAGSYAASGNAVNSTIELTIILPGGTVPQPFGTVTFNEGTITFSGGGNLAPEGSIVILTGGAATDFNYLALTIVTERQN